MIRSSEHTLKFANAGKLSVLRDFLREYRRLASAVIDHVWADGIPGSDFSIAGNELKLPKYFASAFVNSFESTLSARAKQCAGKQALAALRSATEKRRKQMYMLGKLMRDGKPTASLQRKIAKFPLVKPSAKRINADLDARFVDFENDAATKFDLFIRLSSFARGVAVKIPIKETSQSRKWLSRGKRKVFVRLSWNSLALVYDIPDNPKHAGVTVGCDQGFKTVATLSDGQITTPCPHGHTLETIQAKLSRCKKGGKGFRRAQEHRKNYIRWSLNQLNWNGIGEVRFEQVRDLRKGRRSSRLLSHWVYTVIQDKVESLSETEGFQFRYVSSAFRSQRCSCCGKVRKANRQGKTFKCNGCGHTMDADLNASINLSLDLFEIPAWVRSAKLNRTGFYWMPDGLYTLSHEPIVRDTTRALA